MRTFSGECERARQWISAGLDGELSEFEGALLEGHLSACKACTAFLVETRSLTNELRRSPLERFDVRVAARKRPRIALRLSPVAASLAVAAVGIGSILASVRVGPFVGSASRKPPVSGNFGAAPMSGMKRIEFLRRSTTSATRVRQSHGPASRL
jgi:ferric-dicitrate binding protein FerR (iron transport regulator)